MKDGNLQLFDAPTVMIGGQAFVGLTSPYSERIEVLRTLVKDVWSRDKSIKMLPRATTPGHKLELFQWLRENEAEGIVARKMDAPYLPGKRSECSLKIKFKSTADVFVLRRNDEGKANLVLAVYGPKGEVVEVGKVSALTKDGPLAVIGSVVTVEYLSFTEAGRMREPVNPKLRLDKPAKQCHLSQFHPMSLKAVEIA
jgi:ATP-dependent DNA ligase